MKFFRLVIALLVAAFFAAAARAADPATPQLLNPSTPQPLNSQLIWEEVPPTSTVEQVVQRYSTPGLTTNDVCNVVTNASTRWCIEQPSEWELYDTPAFDGIDRWWVRAVLDGNTNRCFSVGNEQSTRLAFYRTNPETLEDEEVFVAVLKTSNTLGLARLEDLPSTNGLIGADAIATNNAAFVAAVTNCPVVIASADAEALTEWGIYGGGGTIGALLAALAAAVAALKKKKMPLYPVGGTGNPVNATLANGVLTVSPFAMAAYTPAANAAFGVALGALPSDMESGKARDAVLVIDCSSLTDGQEPTVTWDTHFHPRTDAETDFACAVGLRNVYYISEYAAGEFAVGGWQETTGGSAT